MIILGINSNHANASVCFLKNGEILYAMEEERINRIKNSTGFPSESIKAGLEYLELNIDEIKHVAINVDPYAAVIEKVQFTLKNLNTIREKFTKFANSLSKTNIKKELFKINNNSKFNFKLHNVEHHLSHIASAYHLSGYDNAIGISIDGSGDFTTTASSACKNNNIKVTKRIYYPHSLGIFYTALTQFLGFDNYGDEYKVMGLSAYGSDELVFKLSELINFREDGTFKLNLKYFTHHSKMNFMQIINKEVKIDNIINEIKLEELIGIKARKKNEKITDSHKSLAFAIQFLYEKAFFNYLNFIQKKENITNLCLAGGCANNSSANGKILKKTNFKKVFIQPASTDAGGALGAALMVDKKINKISHKVKIQNIYLGNSYSLKQIDQAINSNTLNLKKLNIKIFRDLSNQNLINKSVELITNKKIVAIFRDRIEWGSRSLGNRSIVGDPRLKNMKEILNAKIKLREDFRPFAPSVLLDKAHEWFDIDIDEELPFMMEVRKIHKEKKDLIPAVTHIDGTGRLQTVKESDNLFYYNLIKRFYEITNIPILLNTSFNENEPIVLTPNQAISTFLRTKIDGLILQNYLLLK